MLEKLPGVASADADKTTRSVTIIYDKSIFDVKSIGDEGRYKFELREDSAAQEEPAAEEEDALPTDSEDADSSMIKIEDVPSGDEEDGSGAKADGNAMPSLDGPSS